MKLTRMLLAVLAAIVFSATGLFCPEDAPAHCDTLDGPVVETARLALAKGEVTPLLKWVRPADEKELKNAFRKTLEVRTLGDQARELNMPPFPRTPPPLCAGIAGLSPLMPTASATPPAKG